MEGWRKELTHSLNSPSQCVAGYLESLMPAADADHVAKEFRR